MSRTYGVVGLGSMGKRRVRDLLALGHRVTGFDVRADRNAEAASIYGIETATSLDGLLDAGAEALVISTPPDLHAEYYERAFQAGRPFFSEANIFTPTAEWFASRERSTRVRSFPSATWQFHPLVKSLRDFVRATGPDEVRTVAHHYGGFLPGWHPWEPYESFYAGRWRTSAAREMVPFEAELLRWIFGPIRAVSAVRSRRAEWVTGIDDTYLLLLDFASGVQGSLAIELHQVQPFRVARVSMRGRSFTLDLGRHELEEYRKDEDVFRRHRPAGMRALSSFNFEDVYRAEIAAFAAAVDGSGVYEKTWADDRHLSNLLWAAEASAARKEWVELDEAEASYDGLSWIDEPGPDERTAA